MDLLKIFSPSPRSTPSDAEVTVAGKPLTCVVCQHNRFYSRRALLNTPGSEFLGVAWADENAQIYICAKCRHIHWFAP